MNSMIYIVEDDKNICEIESYALKNSGYSTESFLDAKSFFAAMEDKIPDLVLLDVMLPDEDGLEIVGKMRHNYRTNRVPIMLVTAKTTEIDKVKGLDIGADDYITKPFAIQELLARIRATLRKHNNSTTKPAEEPSVFKFKNIHVYLDRHEVKVHNQLVELTKKEYDLLLYLLHNHDHVLSREQILQSIWGYEYMGDTNVVDVYIRYLRAKIDDYFNEKYIHTVRGIGYVIKT